MDTLALRVYTRSTDSFGSAYLNIRAELVTVADDGSPRNILHSTYAGDPLAPFVGIAATAQADRDPEPYKANAYGWRFGFAGDGLGDPVAPDILTKVLGTLRKAERRMAAAEARYGRPQTFGQYIARIADALGVRVMFGRAGSDGNYVSGYWYTVTPGESVMTIDGWVAEFRAVTA